MFLSLKQWIKLRQNLCSNKINKSDILKGVFDPGFIWERLEKIIFQEDYPKYEDFIAEQDMNSGLVYHYYKDQLLYSNKDYEQIALNLFHMSTKDLI